MTILSGTSDVGGLNVRLLEVLPLRRIEKQTHIFYKYCYVFKKDSISLLQLRQLISKLIRFKQQQKQQQKIPIGITSLSL